MKHSGKQITSALRWAVSVMADVARAMDSSGVAVTRRFARALWTVVMPSGDSRSSAIRRLTSLTINRERRFDAYRMHGPVD
jgi:hypothetical protein